MTINVNKVFYILLMLGIVYLIARLVYLLLKRADKSTEASKVRSSMPSKGELQDKAITNSYNLACDLVNGFLAEAHSAARHGARSVSYSSCCNFSPIEPSIVIRIVKSRIRKEGFTSVSVDIEDNVGYTVYGSW